MGQKLECSICYTGSICNGKSGASRLHVFSLRQPSHCPLSRVTPAMPRQASFRHALPTPASPLFAPSTGLSRPWVLIPFGAADLGYTIYYALVLGSVPVYLLILASLRFLVLSIILGLSLRWRARGGWVIAITGGTLLASAWAICVQTMNKEEYVAPVFLLTVSQSSW